MPGRRLCRRQQVGLRSRLQLRLRESLPITDVWGLGATLFEAIAGYKAFDRAARSRRVTSPATP